MFVAFRMASSKMLLLLALRRCRFKKMRKSDGWRGLGMLIKIIVNIVNFVILFFISRFQCII